MDKPDVHLTITDLRSLTCTPGVRKAFKSAGGDFAKFLKEGAMASELYGHGYDALVDRAVKRKLEQ